jgi:hypothetical protein
MTVINRRRVWVGALVGGVVWNVWSILVNVVFLGDRYTVAQQAGQLLAQPRYRFFLPVWIVTIFLLSYIVALLYAAARTACGAGPKTALMIGMMVGFAAGFPGNFASAAWSVVDRIFPTWWMLDMWVGAVLAALVAGYTYRD